MAWITERPRKDGTIALSVQWRDSRGKRQSESFDGKQRKAAEKFVKLVEAHGGYPPNWVRGVGFSHTKPAETTVLELCSSYAGNNPNGAERYRADSQRILSRYVEDDLIADMDAALLTPILAREWVERLNKRGLAEKTITGAIGVVRAAYTQSIKDGVLQIKNPLDGISAPKQSKQKGDNALTVNEFFALVDLAPEQYKLFIETAGKTGMRFSEITALTANDLKDGYLNVNKAWVETSTRGKYKIGPPKSARGVRRVYIDAELQEALVKHIEEKKPTDLVFLTEKKKTIRHNNFHFRVWRPIALDLKASGKASFAPRFHDLRHSHATWLLEAGQPVHRVAARLGHDPAVLMRTYSHLLDAGAAETGAVIGVITKREKQIEK